MICLWQPMHFMIVLTHGLVKAVFLTEHKARSAFLQLTRFQDIWDTWQLIKWKEEK